MLIIYNAKTFGLAVAGCLGGCYNVSCVHTWFSFIALQPCSRSNLIYLIAFYLHPSVARDEIRCGFEIRVNSP